MKAKRHAHPGKSSGQRAGYEPQFRRIVVGYECDIAARKAMHVATILASDLASEIIVAATIPPPIATPLDSSNPDLYGDVLRDLKRRVREELHKNGHYRVEEHNIRVSVDRPQDHILRMAQEQSAGLIIVGSHGRHGLKQLVLGSVSQSLATQSTCPVMIVGPECEIPEERLRTVLFATDLKDTGITAGLFAAALARKAGCRLAVLHTVHEKSRAAGREHESEEDYLLEQMGLSVQEIGVMDPAPVEFHIAYGDPPDEILAVSGSAHAGLIVLGGGHHSAFADHASWSTLTPILQFAQCPVIVVSERCA